MTRVWRTGRDGGRVRPGRLQRRQPDDRVLWSTLQRELLDTRHWRTHAELGSAIFEWIEACYSLRRRHTSLGMLAPHEFEALHTATVNAA
jgi:transposase InsO family protein